MAGVDADANNPLTVPQTASPEEDLIRVDGNDCSISQLDIALEFVKVFIRTFTVNLSAIEVAQGRLIVFSQSQYCFLSLGLLALVVRPYGLAWRASKDSRPGAMVCCLLATLLASG